MPIINLCKATDEGAVGAHNGAGYILWTADYKNMDGSYNYAPGPTAYWTNLSHVGLCLHDYEQNGYHDSDFFMVVWNPEKHEPETICFATTRGWTYPCYGSSPDATPEVQAAYMQYLDGMERCREMANRNKKAKELREYRLNLQRVAKEFEISYQRLLKARKMLGSDLTTKLLTLFNPRLRSKFKLSLRNQVINWFRDENPRYARPLTAKQMEYIG